MSLGLLEPLMGDWSNHHTNIATTPILSNFKLDTEKQTNFSLKVHGGKRLDVPAANLFFFTIP